MWNYKLVSPEIEVLKLGRTASPLFMSEIINIFTGYRQCYTMEPIADARALFERYDADTALQKEIKEAYWKYLQEVHIPICAKLGLPLQLGVDGYAPGLVKEDATELTREEFDKWCQYNSHDEVCSGFYAYLAMCQWIAKHLMHESPFEHSSLTVRISNVSRSFLAQLTRHRLTSFSVASQRYIGQDSDEVKISLPPSLLANEELSKRVFDALNHIGDVAEELKKAGIKNEDIRAIYPNAICTAMVVTANFREWSHIINLRTSAHAQAEIRAVATDMWQLLSRTMPFIWEKYISF